MGVFTAMHKQKLEVLFQSYINKTVSDAEKQEFFELMRQPGSDEIIQALAERYSVPDSLLVELPQEASGQILAAVLATEEPVHRVHFIRRFRWAAAAIFLLLAGGTTWLLLNRQDKQSSVAAVSKNDVQPGHSGAVLHLSDGSTIVLDSAANGVLAMQGKIQVVKENGELKYIGKTNEMVYNDVTTDKGRQWSLVLPDGSKVWLNAASSIHYPLSFTGKERIVEITGEAYFEVVHNAAQPFRVKAGNQVIEDIGTAFNINAYTDEKVVRTTLVEGSVKINAANTSVTIKPGQQAFLADNSNSFTTTEVNTADAVAWKTGFFSFHDADIQTVMRQLIRWYDVQVTYQGEGDRQSFTGKIDRNLTLAQILNGLSDSRAHFRIEEGKHIVIFP